MPSPACRTRASRAASSVPYQRSSDQAFHKPAPGPKADKTMGFLADKKILITGVLSNRSIAYGVAKACQREGATLAFTYVNADLKERVARIAAEFGTVPVLQCDVTKDDDVASLFESLRTEWGMLDGLLHAIAFAPREALAGD